MVMLTFNWNFVSGAQYLRVSLHSELKIMLFCLQKCLLEKVRLICLCQNLSFSNKGQKLKLHRRKHAKQTHTVYVILEKLV